MGSRDLTPPRYRRPGDHNLLGDCSATPSWDPKYRKLVVGGEELGFNARLQRLLTLEAGPGGALRKGIWGMALLQTFPSALTRPCQGCRNARCVPSLLSAHPSPETGWGSRFCSRGGWGGAPKRESRGCRLPLCIVGGCSGGSGVGASGQNTIWSSSLLRNQLGSRLQSELGL